MDHVIDSSTTIGIYIERLRRSLNDALHHADIPNSDPGQSPLLQLDITAANASEDNSAPQDPDSWTSGLVDVGNLLVNLALRYQEQVALLKTSHTSALLKHQVETKRLQDKLAQDQKTVLTATDTSKNLRTENALLQEQLRQTQLSSASKIDVLHQKIVQLEESLHTSKEKLKRMESSESLIPTSPSPLPTADSLFTSSTHEFVHESRTSTPSSDTEVQKEENTVSLERYDSCLTPPSVALHFPFLTFSHCIGSSDLRIATELMRTEREKSEKLEVDLKRAQADLERLKAHLINVQDESDQREMYLQEQLDRLTVEHDALVSNGVSAAAPPVAVDLAEDSSDEVSAELENAQTRIAQLEEELGACKERESAFEMTISNLESSLVQLQADQRSELDLHTISLRNQVFSLKEHITKTETTLVEVERKLKDQSAALASLPKLTMKLEEEKSRREAAEYENASLRTALNEAAARLSAATEGRDSMVAKPVMAKIFSTYLNPKTTASSKVELMHLMANILEFSDEERTPLGIPLIKPPENSAAPTLGLHALATPSRGLVSMISNATGSVLTGSIQKSKQWLSWGAKRGESMQSSSSSSSSSSSAPTTSSSTSTERDSLQSTSNPSATPSLSDIWIKILLEGSEPSSSAAATIGTQESQQQSKGEMEILEPPPEAFKVPFPMPKTTIVEPKPTLTSALISTSIAASATSINNTNNFAAISTTNSNTKAGGAPQTPISSSQPRVSSTYVPPPNRPESSHSPYLSQQQAMRNSFQSQIRADSTNAANKPTN